MLPFAHLETFQLALAPNTYAFCTNFLRTHHILLYFSFIFIMSNNQNYDEPSSPKLSIEDTDTSLSEMAGLFPYHEKFITTIYHSLYVSVPVILFMIVVVVVAATNLILNYQVASRSATETPIFKDSTIELNRILDTCGSSPKEARMNGCVFDPMSFTWHSPACHDGELSKEFRESYHFRYFEDEHGTEEIQYDDVQLGERDLYASWEQHLVHCLYTWRQFHRAYHQRRPIDSYIGNYHHTHHCGDQIMEQIKKPSDLAALNTLIKIKYTDCKV
jgi:hypothetical protein